MSIHSSLRGADSLTGERSVLTRVERIAKLKKDGRLGDDDSIWGLPKVRTKFKVAGAKKKKEATEETTEGETSEDAAASDDS